MAGEEGIRLSLAGAQDKVAVRVKHGEVCPVSYTHLDVYKRQAPWRLPRWIPKLIEQLSAVLLEKSPVKLPSVSTHPEGRILSPLIGMETGSVRLAKEIIPGKGVPFPIEEWPSVLIQGLTILNRNNWFPVMTLMVGSPGETDTDLSLIHI